MLTPSESDIDEQLTRLTPAQTGTIPAERVGRLARLVRRFPGGEGCVYPAWKTGRYPATPSVEARLAALTGRSAAEALACVARYEPLAQSRSRFRGKGLDTYRHGDGIDYFEGLMALVFPEPPLARSGAAVVNPPRPCSSCYSAPCRCARGCWA
jgi:hypothetical protein